MASTVAAARLTETHRRAQLVLRASILANIRKIWPLFDPDDLAGSWSTIEPILLALIDAGGTTSSGLSAGYFTEFRTAEQVTGTAAPLLAAAPPVEEIIRSLRFFGIVGAQKLVDVGRQDVETVTFTNVSGDVTRHVLNQGRSTLVDSVQADPQARGWARVTDGSPCSFCAMLSSRGPVYGEDTGQFEAHNHCGCSLEPVYFADQAWPGRSREFHDQWNDVTEGLSGREARLAFRQALEGRTN